MQLLQAQEARKHIPTFAKTSMGVRYRSRFSSRKDLSVSWSRAA